MKLEENKKYIKIALTGIAIALGACVCLFAFYRFDEVRSVGQNWPNLWRSGMPLSAG